MIRLRRKHLNEVGHTSDLVRVLLDGQDVTAVEGQSILSLLIENERWEQSVNLATGQARAGYCGMGVCFDCEVTVDTEPNVRACMRSVSNGMSIVTATPRQGMQEAEQ